MGSTLTYEGDNTPVELSDPSAIDLSDDPHTVLFRCVKELGDKLAESNQSLVAKVIEIAGKGVRPRDMDFASLLDLYGLLRIIDHTGQDPELRGTYGL